MTCLNDLMAQGDAPSIIDVADYAMLHVPCPECGARKMEPCADDQAFDVCPRRWKLASDLLKSDKSGFPGIQRQFPPATARLKAPAPRRC
jgi:hypothetical protein